MNINKLVKKLNEDFDNYYNKALEKEPNDPEYWLFMGKAAAIDETLTFMKKLSSQQE